MAVKPVDENISGANAELLRLQQTEQRAGVNETPGSEIRPSGLRRRSGTTRTGAGRGIVRQQSAEFRATQARDGIVSGAPNFSNPTTRLAETRSIAEQVYNPELERTPLADWAHPIEIPRVAAPTGEQLERTLATFTAGHFPGDPARQEQFVQLLDRVGRLDTQIDRARAAQESNDSASNGARQPATGGIRPGGGMNLASLGRRAAGERLAEVDVAALQAQRDAAVDEFMGGYSFSSMPNWSAFMYLFILECVRDAGEYKQRLAELRTMRLNVSLQSFDLIIALKEMEQEVEKLRALQEAGKALLGAVNATKNALLEIKKAVLQETAEPKAKDQNWLEKAIEFVGGMAAAAQPALNIVEGASQQYMTAAIEPAQGFAGRASAQAVANRKRLDSWYQRTFRERIASMMSILASLRQAA